MAMRRLIPLLDRVLVQRLDPVVKSAGGIIIPEAAQSKLNEGVVISVGPGRVTNNGEKIPMNLAEGDKVLLPEYGGSNVKLGDEDFTLFHEQDILGVLK